MRSIRFVTACYILSFVAYHGPKLLTTPTIARWVNTHPSRVRQIVARLGRAGLLHATRGGDGGVVLGREAASITLLDVFDAVEDRELELFSIDNPFSDWKDRCRVHSVLKTLRGELERDFRAELSRTLLSALYAAPGTGPAAARDAGSVTPAKPGLPRRPPRQRMRAAPGGVQ